jgi:hypothetical protein
VARIILLTLVHPAMKHRATWDTPHTPVPRTTNIRPGINATGTSPKAAEQCVGTQSWKQVVNDCGNRILNRERQLAVDFIVAGGPTVYLGRDMKMSHKGMGITKADYAAFMRCLSDTLNAYPPKRE